jgi:hypothetical protein
VKGNYFGIEGHGDNHHWDLVDGVVWWRYDDLGLWFYTCASGLPNGVPRGDQAVYTVCHQPEGGTLQVMWEGITLAQADSRTTAERTRMRRLSA